MKPHLTVCAAALAVLLPVLHADAQRLPAPQPPGPAPGQPRAASSRSPMGRMGFGMRDRDSTATANFRQHMLTELHQVPLLESKLQKLLQIQQERTTLQRQRQQLALSTSKPTEDVMREFHMLLEHEDALTSAQKSVLAEFVRDADPIRDQIDKRRKELAAQQEEMRKASGDTAVPFGGTPEMRRLVRQQRAYDFLYERLGNLRDNPNQPDWVRGFLRGMWGPEELDARMAEQFRRRLQELEQDQDELRRRLDVLDGKASELREILEAVAPPATPTPAPRTTPPPPEEDDTF